MLSFQDIFAKSQGQPVVYNGVTIQMLDRLTVSSEARLKVIFESVNANWRQGICLATDGFFDINNQRIKNSVILWFDTAPPEIILRVHSKTNECLVKNVWDIGDGVVHSWHNGAAMIVEPTESGRRYRCNDGQPDDDFDDLIFRIELIK